MGSFITTDEYLKDKQRSVCMYCHKPIYQSDDSTWYHLSSYNTWCSVQHKEKATPMFFNDYINLIKK